VQNLKPVVARAFPWLDAAEAFRYLEEGAHFGKVGLVHG
jgi:NADPH:quinone reductase-like Zn-dependent oxidoreductase